MIFSKIKVQFRIRIGIRIHNLELRIRIRILQKLSDPLRIRIRIWIRIHNTSGCHEELVKNLSFCLNKIKIVFNKKYIYLCLPLNLIQETVNFSKQSFLTYLTEKMAICLPSPSQQSTRW
jgi:hypothetical protein